MTPLSSAKVSVRGKNLPLPAHAPSAPQPHSQPVQTGGVRKVVKPKTSPVKAAPAPAPAPVPRGAPFPVRITQATVRPPFVITGAPLRLHLTSNRTVLARVIVGPRVFPALIRQGSHDIQIFGPHQAQRLFPGKFFGRVVVVPLGGAPILLNPPILIP